MKKTLTKAISLLMSAVMTISALSLANFSSFAETDSSTEQTIGNQDSDIKYGGLFGSMLSDEINDSVQNNQEAANMDYTVYKIYHDPEAACVGVDYKAKTDCMLFVGFYNDEGTELITSVTNDLTATDKGYVEMYATEALPDHYLIKSFIVDKEILNPLSKPCTYDKYTKQMQEILAKTTEDFEEEYVSDLPVETAEEEEPEEWIEEQDYEAEEADEYLEEIEFSEEMPQADECLDVEEELSLAGSKEEIVQRITLYTSTTKSYMDYMVFPEEYPTSFQLPEGSSATYTKVGTWDEDRQYETASSAYINITENGLIEALPGYKFEGCGTSGNRCSGSSSA